LLRSVTVQSSDTCETIHVVRDFRRSVVQPPAQNRLSSGLWPGNSGLKNAKLVQINGKALSVSFLPHVFVTKKSNSAIPSKNNYSPTSSLPSLLSVLCNKMAGCLKVPPKQSISR